MTRHVLVPVDESDWSTEALDFALAEYPDAHLTALHVIDPGDFYGIGGVEEHASFAADEIFESRKRAAQELLERLAERAAEHDVDLETEIAVGGIPRAVVEFVEEQDVDHVVLGSHGRTGASRILLGSVAEAVARRSPVPVTIVR